MCCFFLSLVLLGPRFVGAMWWLIQPIRWQAAFGEWMMVWWLWPVAGIVLLPWTTIMYVLVSPGGVTGFDWVWIGLMLIGDIASYAGGAGRRQIPSYQGY